MVTAAPTMTRPLVSRSYPVISRKAAAKPAALNRMSRSRIQLFFWRPAIAALPRARIFSWMRFIQRVSRSVAGVINRKDPHHWMRIAKSPASICVVELVVHSRRAADLVMDLSLIHI